MHSSMDEEPKSKRIDIDDPLLGLIRRKLRFGFWHLFAILMCVNIVRSLAIPWFRYQSFGMNMLFDYHPKDVQSLIASFIVQPIVLWVYWRTADVIPDILNSLREKNVIRPKSGVGFSDFAGLFREIMTSKPWPGVILGLVILMVLIFELLFWPKTRLINDPIGAYPYNNLQQWLIEGPHAFFIYTFLAWGAYRILRFPDLMSRLWIDFDIHVKLKTIDRSGGLGIVTRITYEAGLLIGGMVVFGYSIARVQSASNPEIALGAWIIVLTTLAIGILCFFYLIWPTHAEMVKWRDRKLEILDRRISETWEAIHTIESQLANEQVELLEKQMRIRDLDQQSIPTWPFRAFPRAYLAFLVRTVLPGILVSLPDLHPAIPVFFRNLPLD